MRKFSPTVYLIPAAVLFAFLSVQLLPASSALAQEKEEKACCGKKCGDGDKDWKAWHEQKMAKMAEQDARIDDLVAKMDSAKGDDKVEAMAAVINEMVAQHKERHKRMAERRKYMGCGKAGACKGCAGKPCADCPRCAASEKGESADGGN